MFTKDVKFGANIEISGFLNLGTTSLLGWPSRGGQVQSEFSVQHLFAALRKGVQEESEIPFANLPSREKQRRARSWVDTRNHMFFWYLFPTFSICSISSGFY